MNTVCIITALPTESRVFIDAFKLRPEHDCGWRLYSQKNVLLLQTGIGKLKAAAATASLLHTRPDITAIINAGIAGGTPPIGTCLQAHTICDAGSGKRWFPHLPPQRLTPNLSGATVITVDEPSSEYTEDSVFDMEAAGVISAATPYLSTDAIQCIKVISDNAERPWESFNKALITDCMQSTLAPIRSLVDWYTQMDDPGYQNSPAKELGDAIFRQMHFTVTEEHQVRRLLSRHLSLTGDLPEQHTLEQLGSAKSVRHFLESQIADMKLDYSV